MNEEEREEMSMLLRHLLDELCKYYAPDHCIRQFMAEQSNKLQTHIYSVQKLPWIYLPIMQPIQVADWSNQTVECQSMDKWEYIPTGNIRHGLYEYVLKEFA